MASLCKFDLHCPSLRGVCGDGCVISFTFLSQVPCFSYWSLAHPIRYLWSWNFSILLSLHSLKLRTHLQDSLQIIKFCKGIKMLTMVSHCYNNFIVLGNAFNSLYTEWKIFDKWTNKQKIVIFVRYLYIFKPITS